VTDDLATGADKAETASGDISAPEEGAATMNTGVADSDYQAARMLRALSRVVDAKANRNGLRPYHIDALRFFADQDGEQRTTSAFGKAHRLSPGRASTLISQLVEQGYLRIEADDGQEVRMSVTALGERALQVDPLIALAAAMAELPDNRREEFQAGLQDLCKRVGEGE
jgi:DNA-binding MarR family transcriptional regulator